MGALETVDIYVFISMAILLVFFGLYDTIEKLLYFQHICNTDADNLYMISDVELVAFLLFLKNYEWYFSIPHVG